jgi:bacteriocin biosynthesis cyclodehydratase domain
MRPMLNGDTFYFPTADGIYLRNNQGSSFLKGKSLGRLLDILTPYLDGSHTLDEITGMLAQDRQAIITDVILTLFNKGFLKDLSQDRPHHLTPAELHTYQPEIAFIGSYADSAAARFERYRTSNILLIGAGLTITALVNATLHSGLRHVNVLVTDECTTTLQRFQEYAALYHKRDDQQTITLLHDVDWTAEDASLALLAPFDVVMTISDCSMPARTQLLQRLCWQQNKLFMTAVAVNDEFWLGPLALPGEKGCWECAWHRLPTNIPQDKLADYAFVDHPEHIASPFIAAPTAAVVANLLNFEVFKQIAGAGPRETRDSLLVVDLETLQNQRKSFVPSPYCRTCGTEPLQTPELFLQYIQDQEHKVRQEQEDFSKRAVRLFDDRLGLFAIADERDFTQIPCNIARVTFMPPILVPEREQPYHVFGVGTSFGMARREATMRACELYAATFYNPQRFLAYAQVKQSSLPLFSAQMPAAEASYLWAYDLKTKQVCAIATGLAYPDLHESQQIDELLVGVAAGLSWDEATTLALFSWNMYRAVEGLQSAVEPFPRVDLSGCTLSDAGRRFREMLDMLQVKADVYDITGDQQIPTFAFCIEGRTIAYCSHLAVSNALEQGLLALVRTTQATKNDEMAYALPPVPDLPITLRGEVSIVPDYPSYQSWQEMQYVALESVHAQHVLVIPLDHDPALREVLPSIVRVVLKDDHDGE